MCEMARIIDEDTSHAWLAAAKDLGIRVTAPFTIDVDSGEPRIYEALVQDFGGPNGTVVGVVGDSLHDCRQAKGFYCSNLAPSYRNYQRQHFIDTLNDWGWFGPPERRPAWYTGKSWS
jgi:phosphoglycolate phosphatase-like HAD superfamily hydrolase